MVTFLKILLRYEVENLGTKSAHFDEDVDPIRIVFTDAHVDASLCIR